MALIGVSSHVLASAKLEEDDCNFMFPLQAQSEVRSPSAHCNTPPYRRRPDASIVCPAAGETRMNVVIDPERQGVRHGGFISQRHGHLIQQDQERRPKSSENRSNSRVEHRRMSDNTELEKSRLAVRLPRDGRLNKQRVTSPNLHATRDTSLNLKTAHATNPNQKTAHATSSNQNTAHASTPDPTRYEGKRRDSKK